MRRDGNRGICPLFQPNSSKNAISDKHIGFPLIFVCRAWLKDELRASLKEISRAGFSWWLGKCPRHWGRQKLMQAQLKSAFWVFCVGCLTLELCLGVAQDISLEPPEPPWFVLDPGKEILFSPKFPCGSWGWGEAPTSPWGQGPGSPSPELCGHFIVTA